MEGSQSASGDNSKLLFLGIGVLGLGIAGVAGWYLWTSKPKPPKGKKTSRRAKKQSKSPKDARYSLEEVGKMPPTELMKALELSQLDNDYASQINILYILGTLRAKDGTQQGALEARKLYLEALEIAQKIDSEMQGPVEVEIALLSFSLGEHQEAMDRFESGLRKYLLDPERAKNLNVKIVLQFFLMLNECYYHEKAFKRATTYLLDYVDRLKKVGAGQGMFSVLSLNIGEFYFLGGDYEGCIGHLQSIADTLEELGPEMRWLYYNYMGWALVRVRRFQEALPNLLKFVETAKTVDVPEGTVLETIEQIAAIHDMLGSKEEAAAACEEALKELKKVNLQQSPLLGIKHYYFLGIFSVNKLSDSARAKDLLQTALILAKRVPEFPWHGIAMDLVDVEYVMKNREGSLDQLLALLEEPGLDEETTLKALFKSARIYSELANKGKALEMYARLLEKLRAADKPFLSEALVCHRIGKMYVLIGNLTKAQHFLELSKAQEQDADVDLKSQIAVGIAALKAHQGYRQEALKGIEEMILITENPLTKDTVPVGELKTDLGEILIALGDLDRSAKEFEKALAACGPEQIGSAFLCNLRLSWLLVLKGEKDKAWEHLTLAKKTADEDKSRSLVGAVEIAIVHYWLQSGDLSKALTHAKEALSYLDPACCGSSPLSLLSYHQLYAEASLWSGNKSEALSSLSVIRENTASSSSSVVRENVLLCIDANVNVAALYLLAGDSKTAAEILESEMTNIKEHGSPRNIAEAQVLLAVAKQEGGAGGEEEEKVVEEALEAAKRIEDKRFEGRLQAWVGIFYATQKEEEKEDKKEKAREHLSVAVQQAKESGDRLNEARALARLAQVTGEEETKAEALKLANELEAKLVVASLEEGGESKLES